MDESSVGLASAMTLAEVSRKAVQAYELWQSSPPSEEADALLDAAMEELGHAIAPPRSKEYRDALRRYEGAK